MQIKIQNEKTYAVLGNKSIDITEFSLLYDFPEILENYKRNNAASIIIDETLYIHFDLSGTLITKYDKQIQETGFTIYDFLKAYQIATRQYNIRQNRCFF